MAIMIKLLTRKQIDDDMWNESLRSSTTPLIYASTFYLDTLFPDWEALVMDDYQLIMPLPIFRSGNRPYVSTRKNFCQQLGIFGAVPITEETVLSFLNHIHYPVSSMAFNSTNPIVSPPKHFKLIHKKNYELQLDREIDEILRNM